MSATRVVTGATGYTGRYIARLLLERGDRVRSLTGHPNRANPFGRAIETIPYRFDDPDALARSMEGADTLFNTYWIRVARRGIDHERATENLRTLFGAAKAAGVRRVVHVSIANASADSRLPYYRGKALAEQALRACGVSYAILKPTLVFGREDILLNNIAWMLRRFPAFLVPGAGDYAVQPICVEDMARLAVEAADARDDVEMDAFGPETYTYEELVRLIARKIGASARIVHASNSAVMLAAKALGLLTRDVVLTRDEIEGLTANLLASRTSDPPLGKVRLSEWLDRHGDAMGSEYASEMERHYR